MKFLSIIAAGCLLADPAMVIAQQAEGKKPALASHADSVAYAFGASVARDLKRTGLEGINASVFAQAISDVFGGKAVPFDEMEERELIMSTITAAREKMDGRMKDEASAFMERNGARPGVITTASGLQYEVVRVGTGERPADKDTVTVHYKGQLSDGKVFDSSYDRGTPATFPLDRVIQGWQEGLRLMPAGAHYRIYVPYELGYGERGAGQDIPPFSPLIFDVELISVQSPKDMPVMVGQADKSQ
jgi:FKBP-type peptidyl-prolyl cis-trans isomerase